MYAAHKKLYNWPPTVVPPSCRRGCPCTMVYTDQMYTGPTCVPNGCVYQGDTMQGNPQYGYRKPIALPYVNYDENTQRSPYDNQPGC